MHAAVERVFFRSKEGVIVNVSLFENELAFSFRATSPEKGALPSGCIPTEIFKFNITKFMYAAT